jgi:hypothetical protein
MSSQLNDAAFQARRDGPPRHPPLPVNPLAPSFLADPSHNPNPASHLCSALRPAISCLAVAKNFPLLAQHRTVSPASSSAPHRVPLLRPLRQTDPDLSQKKISKNSPKIGAKSTNSNSDRLKSITYMFT